MSAVVVSKSASRSRIGVLLPLPCAELSDIGTNAKFALEVT